MNATLSKAAEQAHTAVEEIWHAGTHGLGIILAVVALVFLVLKATMMGGAKEITAVSIYGGSAVLLYLASTVYHAAFKSTFQPFLEVVDHAAIYLKIAGSYTPFALITLPTGSGLAILITVWTMAAIGIVAKFVLHFVDGHIRKYDWISLAGYVGMGWVALFVLWPLFKNLPLGGFIWLVAGGLCFTVGAVFFAWKVRYTHTIFHLFVLAGSICHFVAIYGFVLGQNAPAA